MLFYIQVHQLKKKKKPSTHRQNITEQEVCSFHIISLIGKVSPLFPDPLDQNAHKAENQSQPYTPGKAEQKGGATLGPWVASSSRNTSACPFARPPASSQ